MNKEMQVKAVNVKEDQMVKEQIKAEDKKVSGKFFIILIISALIGFLLGIGLVVLTKYLDKMGITMLELWNMIQGSIVSGAGYALAVLNIVLTIISYVILKQSRKKYTVWDRENESYIEDLEYELNKGLFSTSVMTIINMILFGLAMYNINNIIVGKYNLLRIALILTMFIFGMIAVTVLQRGIVNLVKEINPEKRGSTLDTKFQDRWLESCDEAERSIVYKASYQVYKKITQACLIMAVIYMIAGMFVEIGILPIITVGILWMIVNVCYVLECMKLEKRKKS